MSQRRYFRLVEGFAKNEPENEVEGQGKEVGERARKKASQNSADLISLVASLL
jgi:hypothetical protein